MVRIPAHRRRRDPYARQILGTYRAPEPDCGNPDCRHRWARHEPEEPHRCRRPNCSCLGFRRGNG